MEIEKESSTSEVLSNIATNHPRDHISMGEINGALHERGFGVLFIVFCLPLLIPLPLPTGLGTAMSLPIFYFSFQLMFGADRPWLPAWISKKELGIDTFRKIVSKSMPMLKFIEKFLKKRVVILSSRKFDIFLGLFILLLNIPICLPFPMSNTIPAISIIVLSLGVLEKDGIMMIVGYMIGMFAWFVCIMIGFALYYGAGWVMQYVPESIRDDVKELKEKYVPQVHNKGLKTIPLDYDMEYQAPKAPSEPEDLQKTGK